MFTSPGEVFISIASVKIYYYGIFMAFAMLIGTFTSNLIRVKLYPEVSEKSFFDVAFLVIIGGIIGARVYYCLLNYSYYLHHPIEIFFMRQGGMSIHGAIIGGLLFGIVFAIIKKLPILKLCDIFSYGLILGQAIGRWGNFFNSEAFGKPTEIFCKLYIPISRRPLEYINYEYFHPTFLYESLLNIFIFLILFFIVRKFVKKFDGLLFCVYLMLYSVVRIFVESLRIDSILQIAGLAFPIIASVLMIIIALILMIIILQKR